MSLHKFDSGSSGGRATHKKHDSCNYTSPFQEEHSITTNSKEKSEKIFFTVLDVTDGRRYKVFLRPNDISRLKISKVRKTLSSASGKPPFSFDLLIGETTLLGVEDVNCAALGITQHTVLLMRPSAELKKEDTFFFPAKNSGDNKSDELGAMGKVETFSASHVEDVLKELSNTTADVPFVVDLNERQRALQAQLFEEAKRSQIFVDKCSSNSGGVDGQKNTKDTFSDHKNSESVFSSPTCLLTEKAHQQHNALADKIPGEPASCSDSFAEFIEGIVSKKTVTQQGGNELSQSLKENTEPKTKTKDIIGTKEFLYGPTSLDKKSKHLELLLQGEQYYDLYFHEADKENLSEQYAYEANMQTENLENTNQEAGDNIASEKTLQSAATRTTIGHSTETELLRLVENLKDDVSNLLALHSRDETVKLALQNDIFALQRRLIALEKSEQEKREQLDVLLLRLRHSHCDVNGTPVFTEEELRAALRNMWAVQQNEFFQQENAVLERRLAQEVRRRREMAFALEDMKGHIRVLVRVRPPFRLLHESFKEAAATNEVSPHSAADEIRLTADDKCNTITINDPHKGARHFNFYRVFLANSTQTEIFEEIAPLVQLACDGVNVSVLAYGQTGSGKTYTILGYEKPRERRGSGGKVAHDSHESKEFDDKHDGVLPRAIRMLFRHLKVEAVTEAAVMRHEQNNDNDNEKSFSTYEVACSLVELYNDKVYDLLSPPQIVKPEFNLHENNAARQRGSTQVALQRTVKIGPDGLMYVVGLTQHVVRDAQEALRVFCDGASRRQVHATQLNPASSRSHLIFTIHLTQRRRITTQHANGALTPASSSTLFRSLVSKLVFVDLAGSERVAKSQSSGERLLEARHINKSLSALGDVVASLSNVAPSAAGSVYTPYRNSTLTGLLQDVIGSCSKTILLACVGPSDPPYENHIYETISTLQFAGRVRCIRNFVPPLLSATTGVEGGNASLNMENGVYQASTSRYAERGKEKLWMRSTKSLKQRSSAADSQ